MVADENESVDGEKVEEGKGTRLFVLWQSLGGSSLMLDRSKSDLLDGWCGCMYVST